MARPRPTVLIVDDDGTTRAGLAVLVDDWGYQPIEAADGKSALKICSDELPRAIVTDLMMPGMDGWAVLRALKAEPATVCTLVLA